MEIGQTTDIRPFCMKAFNYNDNNNKNNKLKRAYLTFLPLNRKCYKQALNFGTLSSVAKYKT